MTKIALKFISPSEPHYTKSGTKLSTVIAECRCGKHFKILKGNFAKRPFSSCGCGSKDHRTDLHGFRGTTLYRRWDSMLQRTTNPKAKAYKNYGGRGIAVCEEWRTFINFKKWAEESGFNETLELDRIINEEGYRPDNCRWVTHSQNNRNKRNNRLITFNGQSKTIAEWSELTGLSFKCIQSRIDILKWDIEKALTTPSKRIKHAQV